MNGAGHPDTCQCSYCGDPDGSKAVEIEIKGSVHSPASAARALKLEG